LGDYGAAFNAAIVFFHCECHEIPTSGYLNLLLALVDRLYDGRKLAWVEGDGLGAIKKARLKLTKDVLGAVDLLNVEYRQP